jgi:hypothetical protein
MRLFTAIALVAGLYLPAALPVHAQSPGTITTVAGDHIRGWSGDGGPATSAELCPPDGMSADEAGNFYFADAGNNQIQKVTEATGIINAIAGNGYGHGGTGSGGYSGDGGPATRTESASTTVTLAVGQRQL